VPCYTRPVLSHAPVPTLTEDPWWKRSTFLAAFGEEWGPVSKAAAGAWVAVYGCFLIYAIFHDSTSLFIDLVFIPIHEGGHLFFGWFGQTVGVAGGTVFQLGVPLAVALAFATRRQILGTCLGLFCFFENFLSVGTYMADARAQALPLLTVGDADSVIHDWAYMFGKLGLLRLDVSIGHALRFLGWLGMFAVVFWLTYRSRIFGVKRVS
jgi:hypothetical protein